MQVLALDPVEVLTDRPLAEQVSALALTVWPFALQQSLGDDLPTGVLATRAAELDVRDGESPDSYLIRLCGSALAVDCKLAVPELQGAIVRARAVQRLTVRARTAVQACAVCAGEPSWAQAVARWEALDRVATASVDSDEQRAHPRGWPVAGAASVEWPEIPVLTVEADGDVVLGGVVLSTRERVGAMRRA